MAATAASPSGVRSSFPRGGPSGGDGGRGGSVYFVAVPISTRSSTSVSIPEFQAERGAHGEGSNRTGRDGRDLDARGARRAPSSTKAIVI